MIIMMMKEKRSKKRTEYLRVFGLRVKGGEREKGLQSMTENERDTKREMMRNRRRCSIKSSTSSSSFIFPLFSIFFGICRLLVSKSISVLFLFLSWCPFSFLVFFLLLFFLHLLFGSKNLFDTRVWNRDDNDSRDIRAILFYRVFSWLFLLLSLSLVCSESHCLEL